MRPDRYVIFKDDFNGDAPFTERYAITDTNGDVSYVQNGFSAEGGALKLMSGEVSGNFVEIMTVPPLQFSLARLAILEARFRLYSDDAYRSKIGFYQNGGNYITLDIWAGVNVRCFEFRGNRAGVGTYIRSPMVVDAAWHTVQIRLLGTGNGAECVIDNDETNKLELANGEIPENDQYGIWVRTGTNVIGDLGSGEQRGMYLNYLQVTQIPRYIAPV